MTTLERVRGELVVLWDRLGPLWGISPAAGRVHAWLLGHAEPQEAEQIAAGLESSRGAVSMACAELVDWGVIVAEKPPGSRRVRYQPVTDVEHIIREIVQTRKQREWDPLLAHLDRALETLDADRSAGAEEVRDRLDRIRGVVSAVDRLAERFLRGGALGTLGLKALVRASRSSRRRSVV
jgi:DNA-binding transcriptional regulator GbsR (MarR family)